MCDYIKIAQRSNHLFWCLNFIFVWGGKIQVVTAVVVSFRQVEKEQAYARSGTIK